MATKLALLSGKGGSGKTTIALAMAKLLADCGNKVLLIDCDLATNGATYFYENRLEKGVCTLQDLLQNPVACLGEARFFSVQKNLDFIPTSLSFPYQVSFSDSAIEIFRHNMECLEEVYQAVILDCQAGYSELLEFVIPCMDENLVVMEPDAVSSSAVRVLYAQTAGILETRKTYQIFNKITEEEYDIYKNVVLGTFFSALPPVSFNWDVRKAFAYVRIPELVSVNSSFGKNIYEITKILFPAYEKKLRQYEIWVAELELKELTVKQNILLEELRQRKRNWSLGIAGVGVLLIAFIGLVSVICTKSLSDDIMAVFGVLAFLIGVSMIAIIGYFGQYVYNTYWGEDKARIRLLSDKIHKKMAIIEGDSLK